MNPLVPFNHSCFELFCDINAIAKLKARPASGWPGLVPFRGNPIPGAPAIVTWVSSNTARSVLAHCA